MYRVLPSAAGKVRRIPRPFRYKGRDVAFQERTAPKSASIPEPDPYEMIIPLSIKKYSGSVTGDAKPPIYDPSGDCGGAFMSSQYQPNNNCYNYAVDKATGTFAQPGRMSSNFVWYGTDVTAEDIKQNAMKDGLKEVGDEWSQVTTFYDTEIVNDPEGHLVALVFSPPAQLLKDSNDESWSGDYHWVRCDEYNEHQHLCKWSQKDGWDSVTDFDCAGHIIRDPSAANWVVNEGPISGDSQEREYVIQYSFHCYMWVPGSSVDII